jgi:SulP family sulfate permease
MGATAGLYGAIMVGIFAAIFGGTPTQASGPTGPMTVVAALVAASIQLTGSLENFGNYTFNLSSVQNYLD